MKARDTPLNLITMDHFALTKQRRRWGKGKEERGGKKLTGSFDEF